VTSAAVDAHGFEDACAVADVAEGLGKVVLVAGQRLAAFRHQGRIFVTSNLCPLQGGPVGEGRIVDGCITFPWHGWNYQPEDGCSPPPFKEVLATHDVHIANGRVWICSKANPLAQRCAGALAKVAEGEQLASQPGGTSWPTPQPAEKT